MSAMDKKLILNALGFNVVWFAWALGVPANQVILPAFLSVLFVAWHLKTSLSAKHDLQLMAICFSAGLVFDTALQLLGFVHFAAINPEPLSWLQPWWMTMMWMAFACTLNHSMAWLGRLHWLLSATVSGVFGYLSYAGAAKLGALQITTGDTPIMVLFGFWAIFMPLVQSKGMPTNHWLNNWLNIWLQRIVLVVFAPLLLIQGKYARLKTPVLPEPSGDRSGCVGNGVRLRLLVAGDSAAAGVGVLHQQDALCGQLVGQLAQTHTVDWRLVAKTGYTTPELMAQIMSQALPPVDVVVLSLGVNDITSGVLASQWIRQQAQLMELLRDQLDAKLIVIAKIPPMQEFTALPLPLRWLLGMRAKRFNAKLAQAAAHWPNCILLTPEVDAAPGALANDGFHPGPYTYRRWAEEAARMIRMAAIHERLSRF